MSARGDWIARVDLANTALCCADNAANAAPFARDGAQFPVHGGPFAAAEGGARSRNLVLEVPALEAARGRCHSREEQAAKALRDPVSAGERVLIGGYDGPRPGARLDRNAAP